MAVVTKKWSAPKLTVTGSNSTLVEAYDVTEVADVKAALDALIVSYPETKYNAKHPLSQWLCCNNQQVDVTGFNFYTITVTWSTSASQASDPQNPLNEPTKYRLDWQNTTEASGRDAFGNPIVNAAYQPFSTDSPAEVVTGLLTAERNEPFYDAVKAITYANAVNNTNLTFHGIWPFQKGQACCRKISCLTPITGRETYVTIQYQIELRGGYKLDDDGYWDGFKLRILNAGTHGWCLPTGGVVAVGPIIQPDGNQWSPVTEPVLLNRQGKPRDTTYKIAHTSGPQDPVSCLNPLPATTILEDTPDATFIKVFPEGIKLKNLADLGL